MMLHSVLNNGKRLDTSLSSGSGKLPSGGTTTASMSPGLGNVGQDVGIVPLNGLLVLGESWDHGVGAS